MKIEQKRAAKREAKAMKPPIPAPEPPHSPFKRPEWRREWKEWATRQRQMMPIVSDHHHKIMRQTPHNLTANEK